MSEPGIHDSSVSLPVVMAEEMQSLECSHRVPNDTTWASNLSKDNKPDLQKSQNRRKYHLYIHKQQQLLKKSGHVFESEQ